MSEPGQIAIWDVTTKYAQNITKRTSKLHRTNVEKCCEYIKKEAFNCALIFEITTKQRNNKNRAEQKGIQTN